MLLWTQSEAPRPDGSPGPGRDPRGDGDPVAGHHPTVFIVDDDDDVRAAIGLLMQSFGLDVQSFASAEEFLDGYARRESCCLVLDLHMPGMKGPDRQEALSARGIHLPVVVITGHRDDPLARRALDAGALAVVTKPFHHAELMGCIERALARDATP